MTVLASWEELVWNNDDGFGRIQFEVTVSYAEKRARGGQQKEHRATAGGTHSRFIIPAADCNGCLNTYSVLGIALLGPNVCIKEVCKKR